MIVKYANFIISSAFLSYDISSLYIENDHWLLTNVLEVLLTKLFNVFTCSVLDIESNLNPWVGVTATSYLSTTITVSYIKIDTINYIWLVTRLLCLSTFDVLRIYVNAASNLGLCLSKSNCFQFIICEGWWIVCSNYY